MPGNKVQIILEVDDKGTAVVRGFDKNTQKAFDNMKAKAQGATTSMGASTRKLKGFFDRLKKSVFSVHGAMITLAGAYGIKRLASSFLSAAKVTEDYKTRLSVLLGSVIEGNRLFQAMADYASKVPFTYEKVMAAATQLSGVMKSGVKQIKGWMPMIGDLAAAAGIGIETATEQVIRMYSAGAGAADLFRERGILAMMGFKAGVSYTAEETKKLMMAAWTKVGSQFRGATDKMAKTWSGMTSMLSDAWFQLRNKVMEAGIFDSMKLGLGMVLEKIDEFKKTGKLEIWAKDMAEKVLSAMQLIIKGAGLVGDAFRGWQMIWEGLKGAFAGFSLVVATGLDKTIGLFKKFYQGLMAYYTIQNKLLGWTKILKTDLKPYEDAIKALGGGQGFAGKMQEYWNKQLKDSDINLRALNDETDAQNKAIVAMISALEKLKITTDKVDLQKSLKMPEVALQGEPMRDYLYTLKEVTDEMDIYETQMQRVWTNYYALMGSKVEKPTRAYVYTLKEVSDEMDILEAEIQGAWQNYAELQKAGPINFMTKEEIERWREMTLESEDFFKGMRVGFYDITQLMYTWGQAGFQIVKGFARSAQGAMSDLFYDAMTGELKDLEDYARAVWHGMLRTISDVAAQMAARWIAQQMAMAAASKAAAGQSAAAWSAAGASAAGAGGGASMLGPGLAAFGLAYIGYRAMGQGPSSTYPTRAERMESVGLGNEQLLAQLNIRQGLIEEFRALELERRWIEEQQQAHAAQGIPFPEDYQARFSDYQTALHQWEADYRDAVARIEQWNAAVAASAATVQEALSAALSLDASTATRWESFTDYLRQSLYNSIVQGMVEALMESALYQAALAPTMLAIQDAFDAAMAGGAFDPDVFYAALVDPLEDLNTALEQLRPAFEAVSNVASDLQSNIMPNSYAQAPSPDVTKGGTFGPAGARDQHIHLNLDGREVAVVVARHAESGDYDIVKPMRRGLLGATL